MASKSKNGFTLIELSIVIVLIGLIVAGVVGGQSLIEQGKLRQVITDFNNYNTALNAFKLEYNAIPGDFRRATNFWPSAGTANGNGNKRVEIAGGANVNTESTYVWQHLALAGIINGTYEGGDLISTCPCPDRYVVGRNAIAAPFSDNNFYALFYNRNVGVWFNTVHGKTGNNLTIAGNPIGEGASLTTRQAHSIDTKVDDGLARTGRYMGVRGKGGAVYPDTHTSNCNSGDEYDLSRTDLQCRFLYWID